MSLRALAVARLTRPYGVVVLLPGLALGAALAAVAIAIGGLDWFQSHGLSALTLAIVLGMVLGNSVYPRISASAAPGMNFTKQTLLRAGVVLYGLRLTTQDIGHVGVAGVLIDAVVLGSTFALAGLAGTRWFKLDATSALLIGAGSAICGAAAVMATAPVVRARPEQVAIAVATVVLFGTLSIFLYPLLFELNRAWQFVPGGANGFGVYAGSTIHEVAQVAAAGRSIGVEAMETAVIAKMVRVMLLAPFLLGLSSWLRHRNGATRRPGASVDVVVPWFAFGFIGVVLFNSLELLSATAVEFAVSVDSFLLAMAMGALGVSTRLADIRQAGARPLWLAALLFAWLVVGGAAINHGVASLLG